MATVKDKEQFNMKFQLMEISCKSLLKIDQGTNFTKKPFCLINILILEQISDPFCIQRDPTTVKANNIISSITTLKDKEPFDMKFQPIKILIKYC
jgi:hypothetical protein